MKTPRAGESQQPDQKYVNKMQEVYQYILRNPGHNEREIGEGLPNLSAPVIHASLKTLYDNGYLKRVETTETNNRGRKLFQFQPVAEKPYEPSYSRNASSGDSEMKAARREGGNGGSKMKAANSRPANQARHPDGAARMTLTVQTKEGPIDLPLEAARDIYLELKKLFGESA